MKLPIPTRSAVLMTGLLLATAAAATAQTVPLMKRPVPRDVVTEEALRQEAAKARKTSDWLLQTTKPVTGRRPAAQTSPYARSIILFDGEKHTLVPLGAILHLPESLQNRVISEPAGDFTFWPSFLKRNSAWLHAREVPLAMAKGDAKSAAPLLRDLAGERRLVVSVYRGGPISILEPAPGAGKP